MTPVTVFFGILACIALVAAIVFLAQGRKSMALLFGIAFLALPSIGGAVSDSITPHRTQSVRQTAHQRARPAPAPNRHGEREAAQTYWHDIILGAVMADGFRALARDALGDGDTTNASTYVDKAAGYSSATVEAAHKYLPPGWDDVEEAVSQSMSHMSAAYKHLRNAINLNTPSERSDAIQMSDRAKEELVHAIHLARVHYVAMGGKATDISDGTAEAQGMAELIETIKGSSK
jgi:hypothetical protein